MKIGFDLGLSIGIGLFARPSFTSWGIEYYSTASISKYEEKA